MSIRLADFSEEFSQIKAIRRVVFQEEQGVEEALEFDGKDDSEYKACYLGSIYGNYVLVV